LEVVEVVAPSSAKEGTRVRNKAMTAAQIEINLRFTIPPFSTSTRRF